MFEKSKVVLIGCLAAFACLLDNFLPSLAEESSVYSHAYGAPRPVRFPVRFHVPQSEPMMIPVMKPVPLTEEIRRELELERLAHPPIFVPPVSDPWTVWMRDVEQRIFANWKKHYGKKERLIVEMKVRKDGSILSAIVLRTSGNQITDKDAIRAAEQAGPFKPLPRYDVDDEPTVVHYTFADHPFTHN